MKFLKAYLYPSLFVLLLVACDKEDAPAKRVANNLLINAAQEVPTNNSAASGTMNATYDPATKTLTYTVTWSGLSGPATAAHIHGAADRGSNAGVLQGFINFPTAASGTYSNSVVVDNVVIKDTDLLNSRLYVNIHTAQFPGGEIRGQILMP